MAIEIVSQVKQATNVYVIRVTLTSIDPIADPVAYVSDPSVWMQILALAGLPELLFVGASLVEEGYRGAERYYILDIQADETFVTATGHSHDSTTINHPLQAAYEDGASITVNSTLGPVDIRSSVDTIDYFQVRRLDGDTYARIDQDGFLHLGNHVRFLRDCEFDIGSTDDGSTLRRPRDFYLCRNAFIGNNVEAGGYGLFTGPVAAQDFEFDPQSSNPDTDPNSRHIYWNSTDNTLRGWDGSIEFIIGSGAGTPTGVISSYATDPSVAVGNVVSIVGSGTVAKADATILGQRPVIGVVVSKPDPNTAMVQLAGEVTVFSGSLIPDQLYFLAQVPGTLTNNPNIFNTGDTLQLVGVSKDTSTLVLRYESRIHY